VTDMRFAPAGYTWACSACGKKAVDLYGIEEGQFDPGWDEACAMNALLMNSAGEIVDSVETFAKCTASRETPAP